MASILKVDTIQDQSGNNIINENADTITIGASGDTVNIIGTLQNGGTNFLQGITEADQWRITADHSGVGDLTANWERVDTDGFNYIGTGMSESSGIFTFPSTGIYFINFRATAYVDGGASAFVLGRQLTTLDNSTYNQAAASYLSSYTSGAYSNLNTNFIFDVTNTTTHKIKFQLGQNQANTPYFIGDSGQTYTGATFIRLGDT